MIYSNWTHTTKNAEESGRQIFFFLFHNLLYLSKNNLSQSVGRRPANQPAGPHWSMETTKTPTTMPPSNYRRAYIIKIRKQSNVKYKDSWELVKAAAMARSGASVRQVEYKYD
jgi:hypothetical protein